MTIATKTTLSTVHTSQNRSGLGKGFSPIKIALLSGAAFLPLLVPNAHAQDVTISTAVTNPVDTNTADNGNPANLIIDSSGSITVTGGTAVTLNSDNDLTIDGNVNVNPSDNSTGVLIDGTRTGTVTINGDVTMEEGTPDANLLVQDYNDGRTGVWFNGGTFTGDVVFGSSGRVDLFGDLSTAVLIDSDVVGNITMGSDSSVRGANSSGFVINGNVTGDVTFESTYGSSIIGAGSQGVVVNGNIDGAFLFGGNLSSTGYTSNSITDDPDTAIDEVAEQIALQSGSALTINGDVTGGVLLDGPLPSSEATGSTIIASAISQNGGAPAVHIGALGPVTFGLVDTSALSAAYGSWGFINRGEINANGVYSTVNSIGMLIENATIAGGFRNDGGIIATANAAMAQALVIGSGTSFTELYNNDRLQAVAVGGLNAGAVGVLIEAGATITNFTNEGLIQGGVVSDTEDAVGVQDLSGTVASFFNSGTVTTAVSDFDDGDDTTTADAGSPTGRAIAMDFSANSSGMTITNDVGPNFDSATQSRGSFGIVNGDVLLGSGDDIYNQFAGGTNGAIDFAAGNDILNIQNAATITSDITFGSGNDVANIDGSTFTGSMNFGLGNDMLNLVNGASFSGGLSDDDGLLDISLVASALTLANPTLVTNITSLVMDATSSLAFTVANGGTQVSSINASGTVTIADGAILAPVFQGAFTQDISTTFLTAATLNVDLTTIRFAADGEQAPFLFNFNIARDANNNNALILTIDRKNAAEIGLDSTIAGAYEPTIAALELDSTLGAAFFNLRSEADFMAAFTQLIAQPLDAGLSYARAQTNSVTSIITQRLDMATNSGKLGNTIWLQEGNYFVDRGADASSNGYDGGGWIIATGIDTNLGPIDAMGVSAHFGSSRFDEKTGEDFPFSRTTYGVGAYGAIKQGKFQIDGQASYSKTTTESDRNIIVSGINRLSQAKWDGSQFAASIRGSYETDLGGYELEPFISADYLSLSEDAYVESGGGAAIDLSVDDRSADSLRLNIGASLGKTFQLRPSVYDTGIPGTIKPMIRLGWSQELITDPLTANMRYVSGGPDFTLSANPEDGAAIAAMDVEYENEYAKIHAGFAGTFSDVENNYSLRIGIGLKW